MQRLAALSVCVCVFAEFFESFEWEMPFATNKVYIYTINLNGNFLKLDADKSSEMGNETKIKEQKQNKMIVLNMQINMLFLIAHDEHEHRGYLIARRFPCKMKEFFISTISRRLYSLYCFGFLCRFW